MKIEIAHYHHPPPANEVPRWAVDLHRKLDFIKEKTMAAFDDLKAAIEDLSTQLTANNAEIDLLLTKITAPGTTDVQIAEAVASIRDLTAANKAETDKAVAAAP